MKTTLSILLGMLILASTGCMDRSTPKGVLASAYDAIQNDRLEDFKKTLSAEMLQKYGNETALLSLRSQFGVFESVTLGEANLIRAEQGDQGWGYRGDILREYEQVVLGVRQDGKNELLYTASLTCSLKVQRTHDRDCDESPNGHEHCTNTVIDNLVQQCLITNLK